MCSKHECNCLLPQVDYLFSFSIDFFICHAYMNLLLSGDGHNHIVHAVVSLCEHHSITSMLFPFKLSYQFF